jgi:hypothetical protein
VLLLQNLPVLRLLGVRGPPNTAEGALQAVATQEPLGIDMIDLMNRQEFRLVISEMNLLIVGAMIIVLLDPHPLVASVHETDIGLGIGPQSVTIDGNDAGRGPLMREIEDIGVLAHGPAGTTVMWNYRCRDELQGTFQRCKYLSWRRLTGLFRPSSICRISIANKTSRNFIFHVENAFRNRGLRVDVLVLGPRIPLNAAVQRQISEGVLAVVRLARPNQFSRKIPLQVFDRSGGADNVRFNGKT